jgi:hypothetical protein
MLHQITREQVIKFLVDQKPPCISLYLPTHRRHPENQQDPIRFRNLLQTLERTLSQSFPQQKMKEVWSRLQSISHDIQFWNHRTDGLAILCSSDELQIFDLQRPVEELLVVADSFHLKPLLRELQATDRYQILALNRHGAKLYEGNRHALDEVELTNVASTIEEALGEELTEQHLTVASYGAGAARASGGGATPSVHGHGNKKDEVDSDRDRFFRSIDRSILEHYSRPSGLPLMLAALPEYHEPFHAVSHNPFLMANGIEKNPDSLSGDQLCKEAWLVIEPHVALQLSKRVEDFQTAQSQHLGASDLTDIAQALIAGRVGVLMVEADRQIHGKLDHVSGAIKFLNPDAADTDDLLDDFAELTLKMGGEVAIVSAETLPSNSGAAAIYRF